MKHLFAKRPKEIDSATVFAPRIGDDAAQDVMATNSKDRRCFWKTSSGRSVVDKLEREPDEPTHHPTMKFSYAPGSTPLPRYTVRRGIGVGGFGEVYFAVTDAGKEVALKRIQRNLEVELRGVSHCLNLKHPNLVALYDVCPDADDQWWVVMEYVAGANLREVLDDSPTGLSEPEVRRWITAIAAGVNHLHSAGLVHRDLKPGNVFDDGGVVKIGDYGLSKFISTSHRGGHTESVGTFHYMAPEIGRGQYGRQIDIYAMGVVLYELLTGRVPFDGESTHEIIVKHMTALPDMTGIAQPYRSTIETCLQKDPAKRFATTGEMMASLGLGGSAEWRTAATPCSQASPWNTLLWRLRLPSMQPDQAEPQRHPVPRQSLGTSEPFASVTGDCTGEEPIVARLVSSSDATPNSKIKSTIDEPIAAAVGKSFEDFSLWWRTLDRSPLAKAVLVLVGGFVLLVNTSWLLPLLSVLAIVYVPYYIVRNMVIHIRQQPASAIAHSTQMAAAFAGGASKPITRSQWRSQMRGGLRAKHSVHRIAELNTSCIAAMLTVAGITTTAGVVGLHSGPVTPMAIAPYGWMASVVLAASMAILTLGKFWERDDGESLTRRLVLAGIGGGVGAIAFAMNNFFMLPLDVGLIRDIEGTSLPQALYDDTGAPMVSAMMAHFALLFAGLRWWKSVDPLRRTRLSLWSVAVAVVAEWGVHQVLPIPQPTGMLIAGGIAIVTQMSAPWMNQRSAAKPVPILQPNPSAAPNAARSLA